MGVRFLSVARRSFRGLVREVESESFFSWPRQLYLVIGDGILRIFASEEVCVCASVLGAASACGTTESLSFDPLLL